MRKYTRWNKELLEEIVSKSISFAECLRHMNLRAAGGNFANLQRNIDKYNIDTSHMLGQAHNRGKEIKTFDNLTKPGTIKKRLVSEIGHQCGRCKLTTWNDILITLELEHIDGNNRNNSRENLTLLCCNCHSQTPTWRNRKR
jgi:5-methylcytosine-specific restriction endonuclease McrA